MYDPFMRLFGQQWYTYTVFMVLGTALTGYWLLSYARKEQRAKMLDVFLGGLLGSILLGRIFHVIVQWAYFSDRYHVIYRIDLEGGLNWHGMLLGALVLGGLVARRHKIPFLPALSHAALLLPALAALGWRACGSIGCAYGAAVETMAAYPLWVTWADADIFGIIEPRFATQRIGWWLALTLFLIATAIHKKGWLKQIRFWLWLALISTLSFGLGYLRGDAAIQIASLRLTQWMDLAMMLFAGLMLLATHFYPQQTE